MEKKVLIISHLATNRTNNVGKTLVEFFRGFSRENLSQLFFNSTGPDAHYCKSWFRITDREMLNSVIRFNKCGSEISYGDTGLDGIKVSSSSKMSRRSTVSLLLRDLVWLFGHINKKALYYWVSCNHPDVIFLAPGYSCFVYRIALMLSKRFAIPLMTLYMDEYYFFLNKKWSLLEYVRRAWLRRSIRHVVYHSSKNYVVSEELKEFYESVFRVGFDVLYTPCVIKHEFAFPTSLTIRKFIYAGGLELGRGEVLLELSKALERKGDGSILTIFTMSKGLKVIEQLKQQKSVKYEGFADSEKIAKMIEYSDAIVHVESFDSYYLNRTMYSISTKIPECLSSGKLFFVIGPSGQASVSYLIKNNAAIVCDNLKKIDSSLKRVDDNNCVLDVINSALSLAERNHSYQSIDREIRDAINSIV